MKWNYFSILFPLLSPQNRAIQYELWCWINPVNINIGLLCGMGFAHCWRPYGGLCLCHFGFLWTVVSLVIIPHLLFLYLLFLFLYILGFKMPASGFEFEFFLTHYCVSCHITHKVHNSCVNTQSNGYNRNRYRQNWRTILFWMFSISITLIA